MKKPNVCELCGRPAVEDEAGCAFCMLPENLARVEKVLSEAALFFSREPGKEDGEWHFQMGNFHRIRGRQDEAVSCYEKAIHRQERPEYLQALGLAYAAKADYRSAAEAFKRAAALKPDYPDYRSDLGAAYFKMGRYDDAIAELREAIRLHPEYANARNNLAFAYRKKRMFREADQEVQTAIDLDPAHAVAEYDLGKSYYRGGMFSQGKGGISAMSLGHILMMQNKAAEAAAYYQKALSIHPDYADYHFALARAHESAGDLAAAEAGLRKALEINPKYGAAQAALENLRKKRK